MIRIKITGLCVLLLCFASIFCFFGTVRAEEMLKRKDKPYQYLGWKISEEEFRTCKGNKYKIDDKSVVYPTSTKCAIEYRIEENKRRKIEGLPLLEIKDSSITPVPKLPGKLDEASLIRPEIIDEKSEIRQLGISGETSKKTETSAVIEEKSKIETFAAGKKKTKKTTSKVIKKKTKKKLPVVIKKKPKKETPKRIYKKKSQRRMIERKPD